MRAADVMWASYCDEDGPYRDAYSSIADAFLDMPASGWGMNPEPPLMRELDHIYSTVAIRWIAQVRERDLLASVLLTNVLQTLSRYAEAVGEERQHSFPTSGHKREITMNLGTYYVEMRCCDRAYWSNLLASLSLFASVLGQWVAHGRAARHRAEARAID